MSYLYRILRSRIIDDKINDTIFTIIIGKSLVKIPYRNQRKIPTTKIEYIPKEISLVDLDFQILVICGRKAIVVSAPAKNPKTVI